MGANTTPGGWQDQRLLEHQAAHPSHSEEIVSSAKHKSYLIPMKMKVHIYSQEVVVLGRNIVLPSSDLHDAQAQ
jgi:hypothetical protein